MPIAPFARFAGRKNTARDWRALLSLAVRLLPNPSTTDRADELPDSLRKDIGLPPQRPDEDWRRLL